MAGGCVMIAVAVATHPFASVTVTTNVPAVSPVAVAVPCPPPGAGAHTYVNGPVPPLIATVADPLLPPKQLTLVDAVMLAVGPPLFTTVTVRCNVQPFASVMVQVYDPAINPVAVAPVPPLGAHAYVYAGVPPDALTAALPFGLPQVAGVVDVVAASAGGCVMLNVRVMVHPAGPDVMVHV